MRNMGWGSHPNLRDAHYWMGSATEPKVQALCGFAIAMYWTIRDAEATDKRCPDCQRLEPEKAPNAGGNSP